MRLVIQRVSKASVEIEGKVNGKIDEGFMLLVGITNDDNKEVVEKMADKLINLRIFEDENEKLNLSISSVELPDIISVTASQLDMLLKADMIEDLTPYYEQYASETMKSAIDSTGGIAMEAVTFDGKMMALPNVRSLKDGYDLLWIRQDWLDELNLEVPKTIEEIREVAKAFIDN